MSCAAPGKLFAGSRDGRHVAENAAAAEIALGDALAELDELIPLGPTFKEVTGQGPPTAQLSTSD